MAWTQEQKQAIDIRNCNLLVSAAAGSGKTSVLVERIIGRVMDAEAPIDMDSIVVVTFTKAAAAEMKDRLLSRLQAESIQNPGNYHLIRQLALVDHAKICTIDSFCTYVLRNYYNAIDLDPAFRVGEEGELKLLSKDTFDLVKERYMEEADPAFIDFVEAYAPGKRLDRLYELVKSLYSFSQSMPWPEQWLEEAISLYDIASKEELLQSRLVKDTIAYIHACCQDSLRQNEQILDIIEHTSELSGYQASQLKDHELLCKLIECQSISELRLLLSGGFVNIGRAGACEEKAIVQGLRDQIKKRLTKIYEHYLEEDEEEILTRLQANRPFAQMLVKLTKDFAKAYAQAKEEQGILDFSDVEHKALQILVERQEDGTTERTVVARELSRLYEEIYIDEYQDSSYVQELILQAVSRVEDGTPNIFMVGDVKQSIYRFRQARPELFNAKYKSYTRFDGEKVVPESKIELGFNFRSCENVLHCINDIFYRSMREFVGDIEYTKDCQLNYGGKAQAKTKDSSTEVLLVEPLDKEADEELANAQLCAHATAKRIKELMAEDENLTYRDFVILLRSVEKNGPVYAQALRDHNIPTIFTAGAGYFATPEIQDITNYLRIIDNPRQDIPLAGVMRSFFAYFSAEELAVIKENHRRTTLYDCVVNYAKQENALGKKCEAFLNQLQSYRSQNELLPIRELLNGLIYTSGYYDYVGLLMGGRLRKENLKLLIRKAEEFARTNLSGLFHFLRYIEKLKTYQIDYAEAPSASEADDAVQITTIHKSKGLEYPVVILGDAQKNYYMPETRNEIIWDSNYGLALNLIDPKKRTKRTPSVKRMLQRHIEAENIGEEIRVLYVALTRAESKLIIVGIAKEDEVTQYQLDAGEKPSLSYLMENRNYQALIAPTAYARTGQGTFEVHRIPSEELLAYIGEDVVQNKTEQLADYVRKLQKALGSYDISAIQAIMEYAYPHQDVYRLKSKYSVSELKHAAMEENENLEASVIPPERTKPVPYFMKEEEQSQKLGTTYGNAYHKFFELLDYSRCTDAASCRDYGAKLVQRGRLTEEYEKLLDYRKFAIFLESELGQAMTRAAQRGELFREQPFIMELDGAAVAKGAVEGETVVVQGIIDAFFYGEDGKVYLVDYKTDRVDTEQTLVERYREQLVLYEDAIRRVTGKDIGGTYLYSVCLGRQIALFS